MPVDRSSLSRRLFLGAPVALAACDRFAQARTASRSAEAAPLRDVIPCPFGATAASAQLEDPAFTAAMLRHVDQVTPEWELKMERTLQPGFGTDFSAADRVVDWARSHDLAVHGHTLIWYSQGAEVFHDELDPRSFTREFDRYVRETVGRYRGRMRGWDVVNEPVAEDGEGLRDCHWSRVFGQEGYILRAFAKAREADPDAMLFLNEYNLENIPKKGATFLKLVEKLKGMGAPIDGIGTQSHLNIEILAGQISGFMRDAASLGLLIHVSELDFPLTRDGGRMPDLRTPAQKTAQQVARVGELAEAYFALPERQRYAFTTWGLRDPDSWLLRPEHKNWVDDHPLLLDARGRPNPAYQAVVDAAR